MILLLPLLVLFLYSPVNLDSSSIIEKVITHNIESYESFFKTKVEEVVIVKNDANFDFSYHEGGQDYFYFQYGRSGQKVDSLIRNDSTWEELLIKFSKLSSTECIKQDILSSNCEKTLDLGGREIFTVSPHYQNRIYKRNRGWHHFYRKYPKSNGMYELSNPVIKQKKAVVYLGLTSGDLDGVGMILFLNLEKEISIAAKLEIWVS